MSNTEKKVKNADSKRQTSILIGVALIILAAVFAYFAVSQPSVDGSNETIGNSAPTQQTEAPNALATEPPATEQAPQTSTAPQQSNKPQTSNVPQTTTKPTEAPTASPTEAPTAPTVTVSYPLNLNTCTAADLMTIDGIGETRASAIIAYRDYLGGYTSVDQLKNISGIGDGIFAKIEPYVTV